MKTIANCNPKEFLVQTNKIRKHVAKWLSLTKILEIRKNVPEFDVDASAEDRSAAEQEQMKKNLTAILDAVLEDHPEETAELLGLLCFVEPDDLENHSMAEFLGAFSEIIDNPEVVGFFISLAQLAKLDSSDSVKA